MRAPSDSTNAPARTRALGHPYSLPLSRRSSTALRRGLLFRHVDLVVFVQPSPDEARKSPPQKRRDPEQPQLLEGPPSDEERRAGAARRIDRQVRDRNADEMHERQGQADGNPGKADDGALRRGTQNHRQEDERQDELGEERRADSVVAGR